MLLAADIGGTTTRVGLFTPGARPSPVAIRTYPTLTLQSFADVVGRFAVDAGRPLDVTAVGVGIAGPVEGGRASLTNGTWGIGTEEIASACGTRRVRLLNDLAALGWSLGVLHTAEYTTLQRGERDPLGVLAVIAPGTGLGEAYVVRAGDRTEVLPTEAGHADFAARTDREWELAHTLREAHGRVTVEDVLSGRGLMHAGRLTHHGEPCANAGGGPLTPEILTAQALARQCPACVEALNLFAGALGAEAGNLALRTLATGGVFIGGGIAPDILAVLHSTVFIDAFRRKHPMTALLTRIPVHVILDDQAGLLGAAVAAAQQA